MCIMMSELQVIVVRDCTDLYKNMFEGTVLQQCTIVGDTVSGLYCSALGSYYVEVPLDRCKVNEPTP